MVAVAGALVAAVVVVIVLLSLSAGGSSGSYEVRGIFDDAGNLTVGEDVKVDGVKVGSVGSVTPTPQAKAAVVMKIDNPGFKDFRSDASCTIRPQALIGEKFVDCLPTQPRAEGTPLPPPLKVIPKGQEGAGEYLLPVANTHSPVDVDLLGDITRLPERQRLTIVINELGAGFAGRGPELNEVIRRADPALQGLEKVIEILANENKVLSDLAVEGDRALAPWAHDRQRFVGFVNESKKVAQATANNRGKVAEGLKLLPAFLEQLGPAMQRLGHFAEESTPAFKELGLGAPGINKTFQNLGPFSSATSVFFKSLGKSAKVSGPALKAVEPLLPIVKKFGTEGKPFAGNLSGLLKSLRETGGIERLLDFIYLGGGTINGYDALGHFLRAEIVASSNCLAYAVARSNCTVGKFIGGGGSTASSSATASAADAKTSVVMERTLAVLNGMSPSEAIAKYPGSTAGESGGSDSSTQSSGSTADAQPVGGAAAGTTYYNPTEESTEAGGMLLNYLLGN